MANKMLIDATHPEETRVVVVRGNRVEEFDFEAASRKPLRGNIYLAKVTRVEPSLQAAFVEYGGNRHGFLAFNEIHPDYYQIPMADRQALLDEEARAAEDHHDRDEPRAASASSDASVSEDGDGISETDAEAGDTDGDGDHDGPVGGDEDDVVESVGAEDALEEVPERRQRRSWRSYKIQEVIKRRQILLVQVVKEERGNKGAALTTYLSLAGRYSVLMPNTARGGGISRKITSVLDRKRLKKIATELEVPEGMGVIVRTAGMARTKAEIKRDFEYLLRLWENVRDLTLRSSAPSLVYEEGSLVKRSIRDLYNKDIDEVLVGGDEGYREAKDFMRMLMPSHAKNVKSYREITPIFTRFSVEAQLDAMFSPQVTLKSGGYIVINQTEALVSIDVNSGKSTREHNIEDTALSTNLEAADEVARQLRLRDLAGLVVIDFIDMEEKRNNRAVEKRLKDALKSDRARIQVGRISHFGLLEMSRQRIRTGVVESSTQVCPHCHGSGTIRSTESVALHVLRHLEDYLLKNPNNHLTVRTRTAVALYILNQKRKHLAEIEARFGLTVAISADETLQGTHLAIDRGEPVLRAPGEIIPALAVRPALPEPEDEIDDLVEEPVDEPADTLVEIDSDADDGDDGEDAAGSADGDGDGSSRRRRRRRRKRRPQDAAAAETADDEAVADTEAADETGETDSDDSTATDGAEASEDGGDEEPRRRRRRGRRGGRRGGTRREDEAEATGEGDVPPPAISFIGGTWGALPSAFDVEDVTPALLPPDETARPVESVADEVIETPVTAETIDISDAFAPAIDTEAAIEAPAEGDTVVGAEAPVETFEIARTPTDETAPAFEIPEAAAFAGGSEGGDLEAVTEDVPEVIDAPVEGAEAAGTVVAEAPEGAPVETTWDQPAEPMAETAETGAEMAPAETEVETGTAPVPELAYASDGYADAEASEAGPVGQDNLPMDDAEADSEPEPEGEPRPKRTGWWQRR